MVAFEKEEGKSIILKSTLYDTFQERMEKEANGMHTVRNHLFSGISRENLTV